MNDNVKSVVTFLSGAAIGGVVTWLSVKKYYEVKADIEVESVREAYNKKLEAIEPPVTSVDGEIEGPETIEDAKVHLDKTKSSIVKELVNKPPMTDYTKMFKRKDNTELELHEVTRDAKEDALAEAEVPPEDEPMTDAEDAMEQMAYEDNKLNGAHRDALPAHVIDRSDFELTCEHYDKITLLYYQPDDMLTNEENEIIGWSDAIGDEVAKAMDTTKVGENDDDCLCIRSDKLMCDFEINKIWSSFGGNEE